ncbi:MAG: protein kinase [Vicinamibacterales bacterium]
MAIAAGTRLGPYEIVAPLGAGGMGEVYRARDTRLERTVAIKVLPTALADDPDRRSRFEREAKAVAALDHPHICGIFDVGEAGGTHYLVMPLVDGQTLATRLQKGPLPLAQSLQIASEIADALASAHRHGIIHRDLKPANVMLTKTGAKLLDFGLAKLRAPGGPVSLSGTTEAITGAADTARGTILGTVHYMAPEQVEGRELDARADIWALGAVLYEMVTGTRAFTGETAASVIGSILKDTPPPVSARQPLSPPLLDRLVSGCLEKERDARWESAADVGRLLTALKSIGGAAEKGRRVSTERIAWLTTTAVLLTVLAWLGLRSPVPASAGGAVFLAVDPPTGTEFAGHLSATVPTPQFALSNDGRALAFVAAAPGSRPTLWVRPLDAPTSRMLPATEDASQPFWSPDGRWVGFFDLRGHLKKVDIEGGTPQTIAESALDPRGMSWGADDDIVFGTSYDGLQHLPARGGTPQAFTVPDRDKEEGSHRWPQLLPDSQLFLYTVRAAQAAPRGIWVRGPGRAWHLPVNTDANAVYTEPGYVFYMNDDTLLAQPVDRTRWVVNGSPAAIVSGVARSSRGDGAFSLSDGGRLAYAGAILRPGRLNWYDRSGTLQGTVDGGDQDYADFRLSPDGTRLLASIIEPRTSVPDVWLIDLVRGGSARLTSGPGLNAAAIWAPDGTRMAFRTSRRGLTEIYQRNAGTGGADAPLMSERVARAAGAGESSILPTDWSTDGRWIAFSVGLPAHVWLLPAAGGPPAKLTNSSADEFHANLSPDGRLVAYTSNQSGRADVFVETVPTSDRKDLVSPTGGYEPRWRADGRELYYLTEDGTLMAVPVIPSAPPGAPRFGTPKALFKTQVYPGVSQLRTHYVPNHDGSRFLVHTRSGDPPPASITVVLNWPALLKK